MRWTFLVILFFFPSILWGQDLNYFTIGKEDLANTEVYTVLVTDDGTLYAGTDEGLYCYRNGAFKAVQGPESQEGNAIFGLKTDRNGQVFCYNLGGQIFKVSPNEFTLYAQLPERNIEANVLFEFDAQNHLIVAAEGCYRLKNGNWERINLAPDYSIAFIEKIADGRLLFGGYSAVLPLYSIELNGEVKAHSSEELLQVKYSNEYGRIGMIPGKKVPIFNLFGGNKFESFLGFCGPGGFVERESDSRNELIQCDSNSFWIRNSQKGITRCWFDENGHIRKRQSYFQNEFIATIDKGVSGEFYFGTFGEGIKVVTNFDIEMYDDGFSDDVFESLITSKEHTLVRGTRGGKVVTYFGNDDKEVEKELYASIDRLFLPADAGNFFFENDYITSILYKRLQGGYLGNLKDVKVISASSLLMSSSTGVFLFGTPLPGFQWETIEFGEVYQLENSNYRSRAIEYDSETGRMYVAKYGELICVEKNGETRELKVDDRSIVANDLVLIDGQLWVGTYRYGILVFENGRLIRRWNQTNGLKNNMVRKLAHRDNCVFIRTAEGFQAIHTQSGEVVNFGLAEGFDVAAMRDFDTDDTYLWMLYKTGVKRIPLTHLVERKPLLTLFMDSVTLGGISLANKGFVLAHDADGLKLFFHYNGIPFESEAVVQYRVREVSDDWTEVPVTSGMINYGSISSGKYTLELRIRYRNQFGKIEQYTFYKSIPFWKTGWFNATVLLCIVGCIWVIYRYRLRKIRKRNQASLQRQREKTELIESQLRALRSQMNPHFIFNSLNAIQDLVLEEDSDSSYDYITIFARLVRDILNHSDRDYIDVADEIQFLETYLTLEKLRFKEDFEYTISYEGRKDVQIPSLLIQPFVENALLHGLMHKKGKKRLILNFSLKEKLTCEIIDNGVGREKAKEILARQGEHTSFALKAIEQRLKILNNGEGSFEIMDWEDAQGNSGTKAIVTLPFLEDA